MGYQKDQSLSGEGHNEGPDRRPSSPPPPYRPPLPPRNTGNHSPYLTPNQQPPTYHSQPLTHSWAAQDPRRASTDSLVPRSIEHNRRTLLLIYIHGFLGDETSFQSFPAHVHNLVTHLIADTHVVHTKIYPKYKSRKAIDYARDDFSNWLCPHESDNTDVILLGHSMGGILSAEVCLLAPYNQNDPRTFIHRILGTINFDTPFLGMHPGIIASGVGSLFRPGESSPEMGPQHLNESSNALLPVASDAHNLGSSPGNSSMLQQVNGNPPGSEYFPPGTQSSTSIEPSRPSSVTSPLATPVNDPNFNPHYTNDIVLPVRKGWDSALHFMMKHSDSLAKATKNYVTSHLEFGGTMADFKGLKRRYTQIRALEDINDMSTLPPHPYRPSRRVRFVNFYTASTGRPKKPRDPSLTREDREAPDDGRALGKDLREMSLATKSSAGRSRSRSPRISVENPAGDVVQEIQPDDAESLIWHDARDTSPAPSSSPQMELIDPSPKADEGRAAEGIGKSSDDAISSARDPSPSRLSHMSSFYASLNLPPIPSEPLPPELFDPEQYADKDIRKIAEKEHASRVKAYTRAVKDRKKAIADRQKMIEKWEKSMRKEQEKAMKKEKRTLDKEERDRAKCQVAEERAPPSPASPSSRPRGRRRDDDAYASSGAEEAPKGSMERTKVKKDRKFCVLPRKGPNGERDPTWVRVFIEGVDEVGAHCGLFVSSRPHYAKLVDDVGKRIVEWVERDRRVRELRERG